MKDVSKLLKILKPYIPFMILSLLAALVAVGLQLYSPIVSGQAIDCVIGKGNVLSINLIKLLKKFIIIFTYINLRSRENLLSEEMKIYK